MDKFASDPINIKEFLELSIQKLNDPEINFANGSHLKNLESANIDVFKTDDFIPKSKLTPKHLEEINDTFGLKILEDMKRKISRDKKLTKDEKRWKRFIKCDIDLCDASHHHKLLNYFSKNSRTIQEPDVVISLHFYKANKQHCEKYMDFDVLGQTSLTALRDKLTCFSDYVALGDFSQNPDAPFDLLAKAVLKSGFFFIEGTFYNDMRHPDSKDLSEAVLSNKKENLPDFQARRMEDVKFVDLRLRLNQPYLYRHLGDCDHLIYFSDVRLSTDEDCKFVDKYPIRTFEVRPTTLTCRLCHSHAEWLVVNSFISPEDPCLYCDVCLKVSHYDEDDNLLDRGVKVYLYPRQTVENKLLENENDDEGSDDDSYCADGDSDSEP